MQATNDATELMESQQQIDQLTAAQEEAMQEWEELAEKVQKYAVPVRNELPRAQNA